MVVDHLSKRQSVLLVEWLLTILVKDKVSYSCGMVVDPLNKGQSVVLLVEWLLTVSVKDKVYCLWNGC